MKKSIFRFAVLVLALAMIAPSVLSVVSYADASETTSSDNIWDTLDPAYTAAEFNTVQDRIKGSDVISSMNLVLVSYGYALYSDPLTGEVICLKLADPDENGEYEIDDTTGVYKYVGYYCTNPYLLGQSKIGDTKTSVAVKKTLLSQLIVKYTENTTGTTLESYANSALYDQITVKNIRGGLRVEYTMGREEATYLVPRRIRFDKWMDLLIQIAENSTTAKDKRSFMSYYQLKATKIEQITDWGNKFDKDSVSATTLEYLFMNRKDYNEKYKGTSAANSFGIVAGVYTSYCSELENKSKKSIEEFKTTYPCTVNFAIMVCDGGAKAAEIRKIEQFVKLYTNYTKEQMEEDHAETDYSASDKIPALFKMAVEYTLDENGLYIRLNAGNIRFDSSNYTLESISVLPNAGAANTNDDGYIFSPDGSGSLFDLKAIAGTQFLTTSTIYGQDYAYHSITGANKEVMRFPAYGAVETVVTTTERTDYETVVDENGDESTQEITITEETKNNYGYLALITSGDSLAKVTVSNGGALHMFASAYTTFNPRPSDSYTLDSGISAGTDAMWTVESKRRYTGDYGIRVFILGGDDATYSGMAKVYREYLESTGVISKLEDNGNEDIPLYIKTLGALETSKTVLGVPVDTTIPLTSFDDTIDILEKLKNHNITNVKVLMEGWCNEGMWPLVPTKVELCEALGGESAFKKLLEYTKNSENGNIQLYPDFDLMYAYKDKLFDGFDSDDDLSKTIDDRSASLKIYSAIYQGYSRAFVTENYTGIGIISANAIEKIYNGAYSDYSKYDIGGIAVSSMGMTLSSDFNEDDPLNREDSKKIVTRLLKTIKEQNGKVLVSSGNYYTWPYATDIVDVPLDDSRYKYTAASIPFYGMLIHGYIEFTGTAINLAGDYTYQLLKTIENGASPLFVIAMQNTSELKQFSSDSVIGDYYSVKYSIWYKDMIETYNKLNNALKGVKYSIIENHEFIDDDRKVVKVTYDNGTVFFINYLETDYELVYNGEKLVIPANDFVKVTEQKGEASNG